MQNLPVAEVYEKEFSYMPWGKLVDRVLQEVETKAPQQGTVLDLMCGPGYLLGKLQEKRPDLSLTGVDFEPEFIEYANSAYPGIQFVTADASTWNAGTPYDVVLCTAGLHHLPYEKQGDFLMKVSSLVSPEGFVIIADPYTDDYTSETEQKVAAAKLGYEYLIETIRNGATEDVVQSAIGILQNDVIGIEFKSSVKKIHPMLEHVFSKVQTEKMWPTIESEYGDYIFFLKP